MENKIRENVVKVLGCDLHEVETNSSLANDLGADALDIIEIIMEVERDFDISITDKQLEKVVTFGDLVNLSESLMKVEKVEKPKVRKTIKKRIIKFVETTYDDGTVSIRPRTRGFNDFELVGLLSYYKDVFKVRMMQHCNTKTSK